jgi:hypothetical protein
MRVGNGEVTVFLLRGQRWTRTNHVELHDTAGWEQPASDVRLGGRRSPSVGESKRHKKSAVSEFLRGQRQFA